MKKTSQRGFACCQLNRSIMERWRTEWSGSGYAQFESHLIEFWFDYTAIKNENHQWPIYFCFFARATPLNRIFCHVIFGGFAFIICVFRTERKMRSIFYANVQTKPTPSSLENAPCAVLTRYTLVLPITLCRYAFCARFFVHKIPIDLISLQNIWLSLIALLIQL